VKGSNWQQELLNGILDVQRKLEDAKSHSNKNQEVHEVYQEALDAVQGARNAINRFTATYNNT
jgi:uncharacterized coiled-coil DUF342 family protein